MLPITKIYIDSRYRSADSVSSSHFKVELPQTISLPRNTKAYITDVTIPNTMTTVMKDFNDTVYYATISYEKFAQPFEKKSSSTRPP